MVGSFVENVNLLSGKIAAVEEANRLFNGDVIPVLREIAELDLEEAIQDLAKGNYLGNRKVDINLGLNVEGITEELIMMDPDTAEAIWNDPNNTVLYDKAIITFTDGPVIELPFIFDGEPTTVSTHGDLLAQFNRLDYVYAQSQVDSIYQVTVGDITTYTVTVNGIDVTYTSGVGATRFSIIQGIVSAVNLANLPVLASTAEENTKIYLTAKVPGIAFYATVSGNLVIATVKPNVVEGPKETAFLSKLEGTLVANFVTPVVGEIVRFYDIIGENSNVERISLHAVSGKYIEEYSLFYWAKTTSAFQTLSMRANDIIRLGDEIDSIIKLAASIGGIIEIQNKLPQLIDTYDENGNPNGDMTVYNNLDNINVVAENLDEILASSSVIPVTEQEAREGTSPIYKAWSPKDIHFAAKMSVANLYSADRWLASQSIARMLYNVNGDLVKIQYNEATDNNYETFSYISGDLTSIAHYIDGELKGNTVLSYTDGELVSEIFTEV